MPTKEQIIQLAGRAAEAFRGSADDLRAKGLSVAVHNDYQLNGERHTFWLLTGELRGSLRAFKGEGKTDAEALPTCEETKAVGRQGKFFVRLPKPWAML